MTTQKNLHPLLTDHDNTASMQSTNTKQNNALKNITVSITLLLFMIGIIIIILWIEDLWPFDKTDTFKSGVYGKYPMWGGNIKNQQISLNSQINQNNINETETLCVYNGSETNGLLRGYIIVDNNNNGYFGDQLGYIRSINLNSCKTVWSVYIGDIVNYNGSNLIKIQNTATLFQTNNNVKGILFGTTTTYKELYRGYVNEQCYVIALNINDGSLLWYTSLSNNNYSSYCIQHGFMIDDDYAFGGLSSISGSIAGEPPSLDSLFIGRMIKININNGQIVNTFYTFPMYNYSSQIDYNNQGYYSGASVWPLPAIIDKYIVFGTGQFFTIPRNVQQCLLGNTSSIPIQNVYEYNLCKQDMRMNHLKWRCLEKNVYPDSLIILNKNTFKLEVGIPFYGVDVWNGYCSLILNESMSDLIPDCPKIIGADADSVAIATYHNKIDNKLYAAVGQKSGQFYIVEIPNGNVKIIKKVGPWSLNGGGSPFNMAVDENNLIAIYTIMGGNFGVSHPYSYKMADGTLVCDQAIVHAINLTTGYTIWQWINPYGKRGDDCLDVIYDEYTDITVNGTCEYSFNGTEMLSPNQTVQNVVIPPIEDIVHIPIDSEYRAYVVGPVTINNNMVFIGTATGDIFIHNILNGDYIHRLQCPDYLTVYENKTYWNRPGIRSGISVFDDRIIFYCGSVERIPLTFGNQVISTKISSL